MTAAYETTFPYRAGARTDRTGRIEGGGAVAGAVRMTGEGEGTRGGESGAGMGRGREEEEYLVVSGETGWGVTVWHSDSSSDSSSSSGI